MGVAERRAREKEALRQSILDAATELIVAHGHENLSIRKIAEKVEYAPSTIYLYFQDKFEILSSICVDVFDDLTEQLEAIAADEPDSIAALRRGLRCYIEFGLANPSYYQVAFMTLIPEEQKPPARDDQASPDQAGVRCYGCLRKAIQLGIDAGALNQQDANILAQAVWLAIHGLTGGLICMGHYNRFPWVDRERLIEGQLDLLMRGMLAGS